LRCEEARRRLLAGAEDVEAIRHLEDCAACFEALEAADPLVPVLVAASPPEQPAPDGLVRAVLIRWTGRRRPLTALGGALTAGLAAAALVAAVAIEAFVGAEPARLAQMGVLAGAVFDVVGMVLVAVATVRAILVDVPWALSVLTVLTLAVCSLWLRLASRGVPTWRSAR
jgi:hypothetical protein